jgi:hypothetical protein
VDGSPIIRSQRRTSIRLAVALVAAALCVFVPATRAAHASTGGGCRDTYAGFGELSACISASGGVLYSDAYMTWNTIPPGACSVELDLVNNSNGVVTETLWAPCGYSYYGRIAASEGNNTYWYALLTVRTSWGAADSVSYVEHLTY